MKEVMAIIRMTNVNQTKKALEKAGYPSLTCRKVLGRGKKAVDYEMYSGKAIPNTHDNPLNGELVSLSSRIGQLHTLMPKRLFTIILRDEDVKPVIDIFIKINSKGNPGDGKIFVIDINEAISIHTLETGDAAV
ncbi:P-II family nitrogen regulator [Lachnospiraceae bacterium ZAX-1]